MIPWTTKEIMDLVIKSSHMSFYYAVYELKGRFEAGEKAMKEDAWIWLLYNEFLEKNGIKI